MKSHMHIARKTGTLGNGQSIPVADLLVLGFFSHITIEHEILMKKQHAEYVAYICSTQIGACLSWDRTKSRYTKKLIELNSSCQSKSPSLCLNTHFAHSKHIYNSLQFAIIFQYLVCYFAQIKRTNTGKSKQIPVSEWMERHLVKN